jgi:nucleoside-diphosphate kinase
MSSSAERSLVLLKPDAVLRRQAGVEILKALKGLPDSNILVFKEVQVPEDLAKQHYAEHEGKSFFPSLIQMITSPIGVVAMVFEGGEGLVQAIRDLLGPTFVEKARAEKPESLRALYGVSRGTNCTHASDMPETGARETGLWIENLGFELDADAAAAAMDEYIGKYDGQYPNESAKVQELAGGIYTSLMELKDVLQSETGDPEDNVKNLLGIILAGML